jgi:hypothetical protein
MRAFLGSRWSAIGAATLAAGAPWLFQGSAAEFQVAARGSGPVIQPATVCYAFETIEQGSYSGFGYYCDPGVAQAAAAEEAIVPTGPCYAKVASPGLEAVIRDECAWLDFWAQHTSNVFPAPPAPAVDFSKEVVVAVLSGTRSNGCYGMEITHITGNGCGGRTIHVRERVPCAGELCTLALTNNYHFVRVCKELLPLDRPLCFDHVNDAQTCGLTVGCAFPAGG